MTTNCMTVNMRYYCTLIGTKVIGAHDVEDFIQKIKKPRRIILLVKAGIAVDSFIEKLTPHLSSGDVIIDGGNSEYLDTERR